MMRTEYSTKVIDVARSQIFYFQSVKSVMITRLKAKSSKYKIDTGRDGN